MDKFYSDLCHPSILEASASVWAQITVISAMLWIFSHGHRASSSIGSNGQMKRSSSCCYCYFCFLISLSLSHDTHMLFCNYGDLSTTQLSQQKLFFSQTSGARSHHGTYRNTPVMINHHIGLPDDKWWVQTNYNLWLFETVFTVELAEYLENKAWLWCYEMICLTLAPLQQKWIPLVLLISTLLHKI